MYDRNNVAHRVLNDLRSIGIASAQGLRHAPDPIPEGWYNHLRKHPPGFYAPPPRFTGEKP